MRSGLVVIAGLIAGLAGSVQAAERVEAGVPQNAGGCPSLMTELECQAHRQIMAVLSHGAERNAYLGMHEQLLGERRALCGASPPENNTVMLRR